MSEELAHWEVEWLLQWRSGEGSPKYCQACRDLADQIGAIPHEIDPEAAYPVRVRVAAALYTDLLQQARAHMQSTHPNQLTEVVKK